MATVSPVNPTASRITILPQLTIPLKALLQPEELPKCQVLSQLPQLLRRLRIPLADVYCRRIAPMRRCRRLDRHICASMPSIWRSPLRILSVSFDAMLSKARESSASILSPTAMEIHYCRERSAMGSFPYFVSYNSARYRQGAPRYGELRSCTLQIANREITS
jgi:hypothetical protein